MYWTLISKGNPLYSYISGLGLARALAGGVISTMTITRVIRLFLFALVLSVGVGTVVAPTRAAAQSTLETNDKGELVNGPTYGDPSTDWWGTRGNRAGTLGGVLNGRGGTTGVCFLMQWCFDALAVICALLFFKELVLSMVGNYNGRQFRKAFVLLFAAGILTAPYSVFRLVGLSWIANSGAWTCIRG